MLTFTHTGGMEDILYSLYFCRQLGRRYNIRKFHFHIQTGDLISQQEVNFLKPLLQSQIPIEILTIGSTPPKKAINLSRFRTELNNVYFGDKRDIYYQFNSNNLPRHFDIENIRLKEPIIEKYKDKLIISINDNINLNLKLIEKYRDHLVFIGLQKQYQIFKNKYFNLEYLKVDNMLEAAQYMAGSKGFVGNQNVYYAVTESMKLPRILLTTKQTNITPIGGWTAIASINEKMVSSVENLLNYVDIDDRKTKGKKDDNTTKESHQSIG